MNRYRYRQFSQNHPEEASIDAIVRAAIEYDHNFLHLTGFIRSKVYARGETLTSFVAALRSALQLQPLRVTMTKRSSAAELQALHDMAMNNADVDIFAQYAIAFAHDALSKSSRDLWKQSLGNIERALTFSVSSERKRVLSDVLIRTQRQLGLTR